MPGPARHARIFLAFLRYHLAREMSFRANFLIFTLTELLWLGLVIAFYEVIYGRTAGIAGWSREQMLLLLGTHYTVMNLFHGFFFESCIELSELIRTGRLDFLLVKPAGTQFLVSVSKIDYSALANVPFGIALTVYAGGSLGLRPGPAEIALYVVLILAGLAILYSLMFLLSTTAIWAVRTQFLYEAWFHLTSFGRYPESVYGGGRGESFGRLRFVLTYLFPILVVANWPARQLLSDDPEKMLRPELVGFAAAAAVVLAAASGAFFRRALRSYRSASS
jgi:ABC-2 type transport system permease protein